jgi:hypothetical protein
MPMHYRGHVKLEPVSGKSRCAGRLIDSGAAWLYVFP